MPKNVLICGTTEEAFGKDWVNNNKDLKCKVCGVHFRVHQAQWPIIDGKLIWIRIPHMLEAESSIV